MFYLEHLPLPAASLSIIYFPSIPSGLPPDQNPLGLAMPLVGALALSTQTVAALALGAVAAAAAYAKRETICTLHCERS